MAIIPPEPVYTDAVKWKRYFAEYHDSKVGLKSPPHLTVHMPFKLNDKREDELIEVMASCASNKPVFEMTLNGFGQFKKRVVFIDVEPNESLHDLFLAIRKEMKLHFNIFNADYKNRGFNPHLTLAFRDLKRLAFESAWPEFEGRAYRERFKVKDFTLLKHDGKMWHPYRSFPLKNSD